MDKQFLPEVDPATVGAVATEWAERVAKLDQSVDPFGIGKSLGKVAEGWLTHPARATVQCWANCCANCRNCS